jgi:hypothetical protein
MQKTTFFCDRCNKQYYRTTGRYLKLLNELDKQYDLCPECFESLRKWLNREPENEKAGE